MQRSPSETDATIEAILIAGYRAMSPARKRHPNATERELYLRLACRWLEPDLMPRAFDWHARLMGY